LIKERAVLKRRERSRERGKTQERDGGEEDAE